MDHELREYLEYILATTERGDDASGALRNILDEHILKAIKRRLSMPFTAETSAQGCPSKVS